MRPSIGRIVLFRDGTHGTVRPAIVLEVFEHDRVDLEVFGVVGITPSRFPTRVAHGVAGDGLPLERCWTWPPRQPAE